MNLSDFSDIKLQQKLDFENSIGNGYNNSESSFVTMYMWQHYNNVKYCLNDNVIYSIYKTKDGKYASYMPYGKIIDVNLIIPKLLNFYNQLNCPLILELCTEDFVSMILRNTNYNIYVIETENSHDYIYKTDDLIKLSGKRYHAKKSHINSFSKKYDFEYIRYLPYMKNDVNCFCENVLKQHYGDDINGFLMELDSIKKVIDNIEYLGVKCSMLTIHNQIVALAIGEFLNDNYALIHVEKADYMYRDAYSVINNLFLKNEFSSCKYVNREEDMGMEGLRIAKKSYHPCEMIKKYTVIFK